MFTLTKINLLWDKVKALTAQVDNMAKIPRGSAVIGLMSGALSIPESSRNEIGDAFKKNIPCFIAFSSSSIFKNMYRVTQCYYDITTGALTEIVAIQMKKNAVGHYYIDAKANNGWSAEVIAVDESGYTPPNYSTNEVNTGVKWIDGKDIYRKTIIIDDFTAMTTGVSSPNLLSHLIENLDEIVDYFGSYRTGTEGSYTYSKLKSVDLSVSSGYSWTVMVYDFTASTYTLMLGTAIKSNINKLALTVLYTKATPATLTRKKTTKKEEDNK